MKEISKNAGLSVYILYIRIIVLGGQQQQQCTAVGTPYMKLLK